MRHRSVADLMTPTAVSVAPGTTFKGIARVLKEFDITAVCVAEKANRPLGVVSEADLVRRRAAGAELDTAGALMSSPAVVARPEWSVVRAARVMDRARVKHLLRSTMTGGSWACSAAAISSSCFCAGTGRSRRRSSRT